MLVLDIIHRDQEEVEIVLLVLNLVVAVVLNKVVAVVLEELLVMLVINLRRLLVEMDIL